MQKYLKNYFEAIFNLLIFFPYFFSVPTLIKTLFHPWKNLIAKKTGGGFSFSEWINRLAFNLISRGIGFFMRISLLSFYFLISTFYLLSLPLIFILYLLSSPLFYLRSLFSKSEEEKKQLLKNRFLSTHLLKEENRPAVENWFEIYYQKHYQKQRWWKPLARDWAVGYTPTLDSYSTDLANPSYLSQRKSIVNREKEIIQIERILSKSEEANVVIVGEEGVGKHTIVDALAKKIYEGETTNILAYKRIIKLNLEKILAETTDQKQRENLLEQLFSEAAEARNIILLIDDFDKYIFLGEGRIDLTTSIEKFAKTENLQFIGITTAFFYQKFIQSNDSIHRIFTKVDVFEIVSSEAEEILLQTFDILENRHQVVIPYETIKTAIEKSEFYITEIPFPEKAIELLDLACSYANNIKKIVLVLPEYIDAVLTEKTHIPTTLTFPMKEKLLNLEKLLREQIVQQEEAVNELASALRRSFLLIGKRKKPLAAFLFLGPTGVGKTETAKAIANVFFSNIPNSSNLPNLSKYLLRFDMSQYQSQNDIPKLIGDMTSGNPGLLTSAIRQQPYGVLLLDEIEKADKNLINIFLTVLDEGYFTDSYGKRVDCKNLVIIATSNAGREYQKIFAPELLNRFDGIVVFKPLTNQSVFLLAKKMLIKIAEDIYKLHQVKIQVSDELINQLINTGYHPQFGARDMERIIRREIEDKVARMVLEGKAKEGDIIIL